MLQRQTAFKVPIGVINNGKVNLDGERFSSLEFGGRTIVRVNIVGNIVDKYSNPEKKYASLTLDDGSGQIRLKGFSDQFDLLNDPDIGDTVYIIGMIRYFNNELYVLPEIIKRSDPRWLGIRRLELKDLLTLMENQPVAKEEPQSQQQQPANSSHAAPNNTANPPASLAAKDDMEGYVVEATIKQEKVIFEKPNESISPAPPQQQAQSTQPKEAFQTAIVPPPQIDSPKLNILGMIRKEGEMGIDKLVVLSGMQKAELQPLINDLLTEGEIYESKPGYLCSLN